MKLAIMRHAHAKFINENDFDRELTVKGELQAQKAKEYLFANFEIDLIITSNAIRTLQTANYIKDAFNGVDIKSYDYIYSGSSDTILDNLVISTNTLIIGHNPTIMEVAKNICEDESLYLNKEEFSYMSSAKIMLFNYFDSSKIRKSSKFITSVEFE